MKKWLKRLFILMFVALAMDVVIFAAWWSSCPLESRDTERGTVLRRELHFNPFIYYAGFFRVWEPGFWWVEHIGGWEEGGYAAMGSASVLEFFKLIPEPVAAHEPPPSASVSNAPDDQMLDSQPAPDSSGGR